MSKIICLKFSIGDKVLIKGPNIEGIVSAVKITRYETLYHVGYWIERSFSELAFNEDELESR